MRTKLILILVLLALIIVGCQSTSTLFNEGAELTSNFYQEVTNKTNQENLRISTAENIAFSIRSNNLQEIDLENIHSENDFYEMLDKLNFAIDYANKHIDSNIDPFPKERSTYDNFMKQVTKWSPLIDNYNSIINYSHMQDGKVINADKLLVATGGLCIETTLITSSTLHKAVFTEVGPFFAKTGLLRLNQICRPCVSNAMKSSYWGAKNFVVETGSELWNYVAK